MFGAPELRFACPQPSFFITMALRNYTLIGLAKRNPSRAGLTYSEIGTTALRADEAATNVNILPRSRFSHKNNSILRIDALSPFSRLFRILCS